MIPKNDPICPSIFMKKYGNEFSIIAFILFLKHYGTPKDLPKAREFEMKNLGMTKFCVGLKIKHLKNRILYYKKLILQIC